MFEDKRSKRVVLVAHCILNQSAKIDGCAHYPGPVGEVITALIEAGVGISQMPCPELLCLGLDRRADPQTERTIESEDTRVGRLMSQEPVRMRCRTLASDLVYQIEEYRKNGFTVLGVIGVNGSPTCGVELSWFEDQEQAYSGVFIETLREVLAAKGIDLPMRGIKVYQPERALAAVRGLLGEEG